jgi:hypothetical protein
MLNGVSESSCLTFRVFSRCRVLAAQFHRSLLIDGSIKRTARLAGALERHDLAVPFRLVWPDAASVID